MHFNKRNNNSGSSENLLTTTISPSSSAAAAAAASLSSSSAASTALRLSSSLSSSSSSPSLSSFSPLSTPGGVRMGLWCFLLLALVLMAHQQPCEGRYLPTRSHGDDLDKLRELMLQILESSNEDQRPPNEANGNTMAAQRANWLNKLGGGGPMDGMEARKYAATHGVYDNGRYY
ncbi:proctolin [Haematobia irritans]|uniref:proctolin n=1 Tax=Haematobia irritans TaxID=7368 RepID=UPI003F4FAFE7